MVTSLYSLLLAVLFFGVPLGALVFFIVSLVRFLSARSANQNAPDTFSPAEMQKRRILLIVSGVLAGAFLLVVIAVVVLLFTAVAFM